LSKKKRHIKTKLKRIYKIKYYEKDYGILYGTKIYEGTLMMKAENVAGKEGGKWV